MKRFFCLFAVIIMLAVSLLGCSQGEMNDNGNSNADSQSNINEPAEETAESRGPEDDNEKADKEIPDEWVSTELFGVPQETEEYILHEDIYPDDIVYDIYMELHDDGEVLQEYHEINYLSTYEGTYKGLTDDDLIIISDIELSAYSSVFFNQLEEIEIGDTVYFKPDLDAEIIYTIEAKPEE
jgi:hypothetical protein